MKHKLTKISIIILILLTSAAFTATLTKTDKFSSNVFINGIEISRLTKEEAVAKLKERTQPLIDNGYFKLSSDNKSWRMNYSDVGAYLDYENAISQAYKNGQTNNILNDVIEQFFSRSTRNDIIMPIIYNQGNIVNLLNKIAVEINTTASDASIEYSPNGFIYTEDIDGKTLDNDLALSLISKKIESLETGTIELPFINKIAVIKKSDLIQAKDILGQFETKFNAKDVDRVSNLAIANKSLTNVLIMPRETFSLNKTIGPRLEKYGFKMAKVIVNNQLVQGIGGGICQVSSTLYNAVLLSNLKIIERKNHSLPSTYVDLGRDATISGDTIDFKFINNTNSPILIYGQLKGDTLRYTIFGKNEFPNRSVKIVTEVISKTEPTISEIEDPTLPSGTVVEERTAYPAFVVKSYRRVLEDGNEVYTEPLFTDKYPLVNGIKRIGTKPISPKTETDLTLPVSGSGE